MRHINYDLVKRSARTAHKPYDHSRVAVRKANEREAKPRYSLILLDWSCRERFDPLHWLNAQHWPRDDFELIWVELHDRVAPEAMELADAVITCGQRGMYHKHAGYNVGLLHARGDLICICDSDAVFPSDYMKSVFDFFYPNGNDSPPQDAVLMHYEGRISIEYPPGLRFADELKEPNWHWWGLHPNVGACMTVPRDLAIRFGGFDEHKSYSGYLCGPYDLGWRLVNAGFPEVWHPYSTMLWHFAHPDPIGTQGIVPDFSNLRQLTYAHVDLHSWTAVEMLSSGRMQPLQENPEIFRMRMERRRIGTDFEARYAVMCGPEGFSQLARCLLQVELALTIPLDAIWNAMKRPLARKLFELGSQHLGKIRGFGRIRSLGIRLGALGKPPETIWENYRYNVIRFRKMLIAIPKSFGLFDLLAPGALQNPGITVMDSAEILAMITHLEGCEDTSDEPILAIDNYMKSNINVILHGNTFFARSHADGPFALDDKNKPFPTVAAARRYIEDVMGVSTFPPLPEILR